ncbi:putative alpha- glucosyltransferase alg10 protein [Phaeoacremonium minimum UCRPA7]|uniref:Dol-P-Glc:Glc(2)Man(9)GlcNAc(2)-PP-Dol alpha-1,2-glucosyltransferase n=1 Tax=Phaeoacremonium minimum (strain UCR-PA7) TaxID=1286976 RepID=R8BP97_PHAM7|nr:putative alpha- glucosyltransferase alg10 protein [Phaeoacremonium minimum UCRPA7]EOO01154.1 putative alpha- glucosyltransferase alg10 protein [Phaeoacremonium minimum UCRPA7]
MFYIFRYTILRSIAMRYLLIPVYTVSRWLCWKALSGCWFNIFGPQAPECPVSKQSNSPVTFYNRPFPEPLLFRSEARSDAEEEGSNNLEQPPSKLIETLDEKESNASVPPPTSTALLWLLTTSLSLITAPLVEPRYFILPWVFWRLLVPAWPVHVCTDPLNRAHRLDRVRGVGWLFSLGRKMDLRLVLETMWFLLINFATMYIFLTRPFFWKDENGTLLDGGRVQRFMW